MKCRKTDIIGHVPIFTRLQKVKYIIQNPTTGDHRGYAIKNSSCQKKLLKQYNCSDFTGKVADLVFLLRKETRVLFSQTKNNNIQAHLIKSTNLINILQLLSQERRGCYLMLYITNEGSINRIHV